MTELSPGTHLVPKGAENPPPGTVGKLIASTEMRICSLDDPGKDAAPGEEGEIAIRGPQVMKGYLGRPEDTAQMIDADGWLHTGDIGRVDDGWLFVVDRVKELIKYKGFQVAPAELEALLLTHEGIADAAVIGVYDENGNEIPKAYVVRQCGRRRPHRGRHHRLRRRARRAVQEDPPRRIHRRGSPRRVGKDPQA